MVHLRLLISIGFLACFEPVRGAVLESFHYADDPGFAAAWRPGPGAPDAHRASDGAQFMLPFDGECERVFWDRDVHLDLSRFTALELDLSIDRPDALRTLMIYLKSGNGWYVGGSPLKSGGRQRLRIPKSAFAAEGSPAGWDRIERIRLSPWRGTPVAARLTAHRLHARIDEIHIIQSTVSAPTAAERLLATRATERVSRWLSAAGIRHAVITEDELNHEILAGSRLLILPYNARPTEAQLAHYRAHAEAGGKFIVCFSDSEALAELLGISLGESIEHREPGRFAGFEFERPSDFNVPGRVYQQSWAVRVARPLEGRGRIIAQWIRADGSRQPEPAWIETDCGLWMTHLLLDDDRAGKEQLLTGLVASLVPDIWQDVAREAVANAGKIDGFGSFDESDAGIRQMSNDHPAHDEILAALDQAQAAYRTATRLLHEERYPEALEQARRARHLLALAYSRAQRAPTNEIRAVWDHDAVGWYPGDWDRTMQELKAAGINTLFVNTLWAGLAHYPSAHVPSSHTYRRFGDQMKAALEAGRRHGISVHAWVVLWNVGNAPPEWLTPLRAQGRLQQSADGAEVAWLNPALPENRRHMLAAIEELAATYAPDGIHLDYIRYPSAQSCFAPASRSAFERWLGRATETWPAAGDHDYRRWRAEVITEFVRDVRRAVRAINPAIQLSGAVWGGYPEIIESIGQDWGLWLHEELLDFVVPMNYAEDTYRFSALTHKQLHVPGARGRIIPGIGVVSGESQLRPDQVVEQIALARRLGAPGFALYKLSQTLRTETLPLLREGAIR